MRLFLAGVCLLAAVNLQAQDDWIAPEGKILNYRTLNWNDFMGKEDQEFAKSLAEQNLRASAYVSPRIYFYVDSGEVQENGRVRFKFTVKCAFQSKAFARESTKQEHSNYVLIHEQDHYDIALTYANKLQELLSSRDYDRKKYNEEIDKLVDAHQTAYYNTQETYDNEVNPNGRDDKPKQYLWDMRIKKCMENNTLEFFNSPESVVSSVKAIGQTVKRREGEPALQFVVRCRPLYTEFPQEMTSKVMENNEWTKEKSVFAFYTQKYYVNEDGDLPRYNYRSFGYVFIPNGKDTYKRVFIDTFINAGNPVKIVGAFFANVDSDAVKELVVMATSTQKNAEGTGTLYINKVYDNVTRIVPGKLRKMEDINAKIEGGFEGDKGGKPSKARYKTEKEVADVLAKLNSK